MRLTKLMFVFAGSVDKCWFAVQVKTSITIIAFHRPANGAYAVRCCYLIGSYIISPFNHRSHFVQIRPFDAPANWICDGRRLTNDFGFTCFQRYFFCNTKHSDTVFVIQLIHYFNVGSLRRVVFYFCFNKQRIGFIIVPYMNAKRFDANIIRHFKHHRTENAKRLRTFAKPPFRRATTAYPRHVRNHLRMFSHHFQLINLSQLDVVSHIKCKSGAAAHESSQFCTVKGYRCIRSNALEAQEILFPITCIRSCKSLGVSSSAM